MLLEAWVPELQAPTRHCHNFCSFPAVSISLFNPTQACFSPKEKKINKSHDFGELLTYLIHENKYMIIKIKSPPTYHLDTVPRENS